ncbi:hypothetical protein HYU20_01740 [Candidatus Woesearchaeota archaeon]|nr:hypothetical protein [Candidatus Woesearchaeota archaeon]
MKRGCVKRYVKKVHLTSLGPGSDPKEPDEYIALKKFLGEKGEGIRNVLYGALEQATQEIHPGYILRSANQVAGGIVTVLVKNSIETRGDLEGLLEKGWGAIQAVKGLVNLEPQGRERLTVFLRACEILNYQVPPEAVAASLLKYRGGDSKPVKDGFRDPLEQAVREDHPDWNERNVHRIAGATIAVFESNGILFMSGLERLAQRVAKEGKSALQAVKGLVSQDPRKRAQVGYVMRAFEIACLYSQPAAQAAAPPSERVAAS